MKWLLVYMVVCCGGLLSAQTPLNDMVFNSGGNEFTVGSSIHVYSIGEAWIETVTDGSQTVTEGFLQSEFFALQTTSYQSSQSFSVYPNPTNGLLTISFLKKAEYVVRVYNASGECLYTISSHLNELNIDLSAYESGFYFMECLEQHAVTPSRIKIVKW